MNKALIYNVKTLYKELLESYQKVLIQWQQLLVFTALAFLAAFHHKTLAVVGKTQ